MKCIVCGAPALPNFDLAVCGSTCESVAEAGHAIGWFIAERYYQEDKADFDDMYFGPEDYEPNCYDGTYSEE